MKTFFLVLVLILIIGAIAQLFAWYFEHRKWTRKKISALEKTNKYLLEQYAIDSELLRDTKILADGNAEGVALYRASLEKGGKGGKD